MREYSHHRGGRSRQKRTRNTDVAVDVSDEFFSAFRTALGPIFDRYTRDVITFASPFRRTRVDYIRLNSRGFVTERARLLPDRPTAYQNTRPDDRSLFASACSAPPFLVYPVLGELAFRSGDASPFSSESSSSRSKRSARSVTTIKTSDPPLANQFSLVIFQNEPHPP